MVNLENIFLMSHVSPKIYVSIKETQLGILELINNLLGEISFLVL